MNVVIKINERKAIPIRAIPFLTDWTVLAPLDLAESLSGKGFGGRIGGLTSYRQDGVEVKNIKQSWWIDRSVAIESVDEVSKLNKLILTEWQFATVKVLPAEAFVWLDEFEEFFSRSFLDDGNDSSSWQLADLKPAILGLDFSPLIEADMLAVVMQGFQHLVLPEKTAAAALVEQSKTGALGTATDVPLPLTTSDIAFCFVDLHWNEPKWMTNLGKKPKWLYSCIVIPGSQGVSETRWSPVSAPIEYWPPVPIEF